MVHSPAQKRLQLARGIDEIEQVQVGVHIHEQVNVAMGVLLVASDGAEDPRVAHAVALQHAKDRSLTQRCRAAEHHCARRALLG